MKNRRTSHRILAAAIAMVASLAAVGIATPETVAADTGAQETLTRDPWLQPFSSTSIWNMPLGSGADYMPANLPYTKNQGNTTVYLIKTDAADPLQQILKVGSWRDRCSGTGYQGTSVHLPDGWQPKPVTETSTPNNATVFLQPDGRTLVNVGTAARGSAPVLVDGWGVKFQAAVAWGGKTSSNSTGVSLPRRPCRRRRW